MARAHQEIHQLQTGGPGIPGSCQGPESAAPAPFKRHGVLWWVLVAVDMVMLLRGQAATILLGRLYFNSGGGSAWMFTLAHSVGSPLLAAPLVLTPRAAAGEPRPAAPVTAAVCAGLGVVIAFDNLMYAYAVLYLPVSTFSLLAATQLAFNAVTSRLINAQRLTALVLNSVVVLTFSAARPRCSASDPPPTRPPAATRRAGSTRSASPLPCPAPPSTRSSCPSSRSPSTG
ncbi:hypothetical protein PVAP13_7NG232017 [Panicum virgatum]|uniref:Uncharacterized protein n=1 Tax=Panicum virgatum TaxID=38727 RepID=A0A8T0Q2Q3_PANVG|nr:hypothetical protein PVAP13_7NG232017 [Panicum virgatum]